MATEGEAPTVVGDVRVDVDVQPAASSAPADAHGGFADGAQATAAVAAAGGGSRSGAAADGGDDDAVVMGASAVTTAAAVTGDVPGSDNGSEAGAALEGSSRRVVRVQINHQEQDVEVAPRPPMSAVSYTATVETHSQHGSDVLTIEHRVRRLSSAGGGDAHQTLAPQLECAEASHDHSPTNGGGDKAAQRLAQGGSRLTRMQSFAINASFAVNVALVVIKLLAAIISGSIVVVASALDSALDILSGAILFCTARAISRQNLAHYPVGKTRLAPVGIVVFASVMGTSTATVVLESLQNLAAGQGARIDLSTFVLAILIATVVLKAALFALCSAYGAGASAVSTLAEDHRNDTISNIVAVAAALLAYNYPDSLWWADAVGAIVVGLYIIGVWVFAGWEQVKMLAGHAAEPADIQKILEVAANWHETMTVDKIRAYHHGEHYMVELEVCLPADMTVRESHHLGLSLQQRIEAFPDVERCFVHIDYKKRPHEEHFDPATGKQGTFEA